MLLGVVLFCYVIMLVSKLTLTTNTRALLFISKVLLFGYSHQSSQSKQRATE